jgi:hypothetical protein
MKEYLDNEGVCFGVDCLRSYSEIRKLVIISYYPLLRLSFLSLISLIYWILCSVFEFADAGQHSGL